MASLIKPKRQRVLVDPYDGSCPDCGAPGGHPEYDLGPGYPRCPENWTGKHLDKANAAADKAYQRYEDGADDDQPERTDDLYAEYLHRAKDAQAAAAAVEGDARRTRHYWL